MDLRTRRLLDAYPVIFLACHRRHTRSDEHGNAVTEHQASILDHLHPSRGITLSKLAEHMGVGRSAMSIVVGRLTKRGYIARHRDDSDGRSIFLKLTPEGARIKDQNTILDPTMVKDIFQLMPAKEVDAALEGIECLAKFARVVLRRRKRERDS